MNQDVDRKLAALIDDMRSEFPHMRLIDKGEDKLSSLIDKTLRLLTLGGQSFYLDRYTTTLGDRIYLPTHWPQFSAADRYIILRHERIHMRQFRRFTFVGMSLIYALPILPFFLSLGRMLLEREAYAETIRATAEIYGLQSVEADEFQARIIHQFTSAAYAWMWPFPKQMRTWMENEVEKIRSEAPGH